MTYEDNLFSIVMFQFPCCKICNRTRVRRNDA